MIDYDLEKDIDDTIDLINNLNELLIKASIKLEMLQLQLSDKTPTLRSVKIQDVV